MKYLILYECNLHLYHKFIMIINPEEQYEILDSLNSSQSYMYVYFHT